MEIFDERASGASEQASREADREGSRRPYEPPKLIEWGSIVDLTRGPIGGFDDVDNGASQQF